jgi:hypothetical protein
MNTKESFSKTIYMEQTLLAELELSAFISAVERLYGAKESQLSAVDWLDESDLMDSPPESASRNWRAVTIAASARLAIRLSAGSLNRSFAERVDLDKGINDTYV